MSAEQATTDTPKTLKEAAALLDQVPASAILPLLRQPDFMMVAGVAFQGFRTDASGYANAVVRRRLAEEVVKNEKFAKKLLAFVKSPNANGARAATPVAPPRPPVPVSGPVAEAQALEKYKAERDRLKRERDTAVAAQKDAERSYTEARTQRLAAETAQAESARELERTKQKLERAERKARQLETTNASLRRMAVAVPAEPARVAVPAPPAASAPVTPPMPSSGFAEAVRHLIGKQKAYLALSLAEDVLRENPNEIDALDIQAEALESLNRSKESVAPLRQLITVLLQRNDAARAADALARLLARSQNLLSETRVIREFYHALMRLPDCLPAVQRTFERLSHTMPPAYAALKSAVPRELSDRLFGDPSRTPTADTPLPILLGMNGGLNVSARQIVGAINRNQENVIDAVTEVLPTLDEATRETVKAAVLAASDGDESYYRLLSHPEKRRGPIVVDGSNIAWHGQEMLASAKPHLEYILSVRKALRARGYFPIQIMADANLPFVVNDGPTARRLIADDEITLVAGGSDADEHLVREAKRLNAPLVTNDYMMDWDPNRLVNKVQYVISLTDGHATLYF